MKKVVIPFVLLCFSSSAFANLCPTPDEINVVLHRMKVTKTTDQEIRITAKGIPGTWIAREDFSQEHPIVVDRLMHSVIRITRWGNFICTYHVPYRAAGGFILDLEGNDSSVARFDKPPHKNDCEGSHNDCPYQLKSTTYPDK